MTCRERESILLPTHQPTSRIIFDNTYRASVPLSGFPACAPLALNERTGYDIVIGK